MQPNDFSGVCEKFGKIIGNDIRDTHKLSSESNIIMDLSDDLVNRANSEPNFYLFINWITDSDVKRFISELESVIDLKGLKKDKVMVLINRNLALPQTEIKFVNTDFLLYKVGLHFNQQSKKFYNDLSFLTEKRER